MRLRCCLFIILNLGMIGFTARAADCDNSREIARSVPLKGVQNLTIEAGAGTLAVRGEPGRTQLQIDARLCADTVEDLSIMDVSSKRSKTTLELKTEMPRRSGITRQHQASIDLVVRVPPQMLIDVTDSSGSAVVENVAQLTMLDSSGELEIVNITGNVTVVDSSGGLSLADIQGDVELTDSSGAITAQDIAGNLWIKVDSSGAINVKRVKKSVIIDQDSSGSIRAKSVGGDFIVRQDGSGGISYQDVAGQVQIPKHKRR